MLRIEEEELAEFVSVVLADTEVVWNDIFADLGKEYKEPKLVLFTGSVQVSLRSGRSINRAVLLSRRQKCLY
jgi:predicted metalloprotease